MISEIYHKTLRQNPWIDTPEKKVAIMDAIFEAAHEGMGVYIQNSNKLKYELERNSAKAKADANPVG